MTADRSQQTEDRTKRSGRICHPGLYLAVLLVLFSIFLQALPTTAAGSNEETPTERAARVFQERKEKRLLEIQKALDKGDEAAASDLLYQYFRRYRDDDEAEDALWRSIKLQRDLAFQAKKPDWDALKERYRRFIAEFPKSPRIPQAYFEVGMAFFNKTYFREALTYFRLYRKRFLDAPESEQSLFMQARCLINLGKLSEAARVYKELADSKDKIYRLRGRAGEGHIFFARHEYHAALGIYTGILHHNPSFYVNDPEILRRMGIAWLNTGNEEDGRNSLLAYLNLVGKSSFSPGALFEIAESYLRQGNDEAARRVYLRILQQGKESSREVIMSQFRLAQLRTAYEEKLTDQEKKNLLAHKDDHPFQAVLDRYYSDEIAQDARYSLLMRHWNRQEYDKVYDLGKPYLRYKNDPVKAARVRDIMGHILELRIEKLLEQQQYKKIYRIYQDEYKYIKESKRGRLLYLAGRGFEGLALYKQAAVVYYRALALDLDDQEKIDLYLHRAEVYLAIPDLRAAQRLLKYLRDIYRADKIIGEIYWFSGRLREAQKRPTDAVEFYKMAAEAPTFSNKKSVYAADYLRLLFELEKVDQVQKVLARFKGDNYLSPAELQKWYGRLADYLRDNSDLAGAGKAYKTALAQGMPMDNEIAQAVNLHYGDILLEMGEKSTARSCFEAAATGKNKLVKKMAESRLAEMDIAERMQDVK
jgi:tetratricopeptide (TPR) repeat protein